MKSQRLLCSALLSVAILSLGACTQKPSAPVTSSGPSAPVKSFLGRWDLTVQTLKQARPSWIEVSEDQGQPKVLMVGFWGHATLASNVQINNDQIEFLAPKDEGFDDGTEIKGELSGSGLAGTATSPKGVTWQWTGTRAPSLVRQGAPKWGKPVKLFNGRDLAGWTFADSSQGRIWKVEHGTLVKNGSGSELIGTPKFEDFKLHVEFNCGPKANSGVYLRGRYEVQIETDSPTDPPDQRIGAIYGFLTPQPPLPRTPNVWQTYDITLVGRTITLVHDGKTVYDQQKIPGITGGALDSNEGSPGPIYLQGSEAGRVAFRNIVITPAESLN
jgi:3-keto-disaccharide hydrolase